MFYSEETIANVRDANNIVDVIGSYVSLQKKGSTYFGLCPFHSEKTGSFSVTDTNDRHMFYCFGCHTGGDVITFIMKYENLTYIEAVQFLAERAGIVLPKPDYSKAYAENEKKRQNILEINKLAATYFYRLLRSPRGEVAYSYFKNRGLSEETMRSFGLGFSDKYRDDLYKFIKSRGYSDEDLKDTGLFVIKEEEQRDYFWNRAMFPIMNVRNKVIGFGGRVLGEGQPKYLNSPETPCFDKGRTLYGLNVAVKSRSRELILVEGYMDVISLHQSGFTNAVAGLGTALTDGNVGVLRRYADSVLLSYDSDTAGRDATLRAIEKLRKAGLAIKVINLRPYKDPDELIKAEGADSYRDRIKGAMNGLIYEIYAIRDNYDLNDPDKKSRFYNEIAKKIAAFDGEIERESYARSVSNEFFIDYDILNNAIKKYALSRNSEGYSVMPRKTAEKKPDKKKTIETCSKIVLACAAADKSFFHRISGILKPEDFTSPFYRQMANLIFSQLEAGRLDSARTVDAFPEMQEREKAAEIFYFRIEDLTEAESQKLLTDCVVKIKKDSLEEQLSKTEDFAEMIDIKKRSEEMDALTLF